MNYKNKYTKYKLKYLDLKKYGGDLTPLSIGFLEQPTLYNQQQSEN